MRPAAARRHVALVPAAASDLLYLPTVEEECAAADEGASPGTTWDLLDGLAPGIDGATHPRDLSEGQRLALAVAIQLAGRPDVLLLDEPTRGLDYVAKGHLAHLLRGLRDEGRAVLLSSHDVEFVAGCADRVVVLADGEVVADAPAHEALGDSPTFSPQVAKILRPLDLLTVDDVRHALGSAPGSLGSAPGSLEHVTGGAP